MKKFNKVLSVVVASAMVMAMAGCGNTDNGSAATGTNAATESTAADNGAASGSVFKIGGIGPTTGGAAVYGLAVQHGAEIAVEEINAAGGINGYQVEFKFQDDEADAEKSVLQFFIDCLKCIKGLGRTGPRRIYHQWSMYCGYRQDQRRQYVPDHSFRICSRMCSV